MNAPSLNLLFLTRDLAATRAFYVDKLGWTLEAEMPEYIRVRRGDEKSGARISFGTTAPPVLGGKGKPFDGEGVIVSLRAAEPDVLHDELRARDVAIAEAPADRPWGWRSFCVADPNGVLLDFYRELANPAANAAS